MLDFILNTAKTTHNINWWQVATPFITAIASFGAVYFGAWLTDKRREKEQHKININKAIILHTLIELQVPALIDYRDNTLIPKLKAIKIGNLTVATEKYPFSSWLLPINIKDYDFLINTSKGAMSALNQVLQYEEKLDNTILTFDNFSLTDEEKQSSNCLEIHIIKVKSIIETLYETCNSLIYYSLLLHRYLTYMLCEINKEPITCSDALMGINLIEEAKNNKIKLGWLKMLPTEWHGARVYQEQKNKISKGLKRD
ncbi:MAG: hypothetical protein V8R70_08025 [Candidatus Gastranaerophilaceae bacterium]